MSNNQSSIPESAFEGRRCYSAKGGYYKNVYLNNRLIGCIRYDNTDAKNPSTFEPATHIGLPPPSSCPDCREVTGEIDAVLFFEDFADESVATQHRCSKCQEFFDADETRFETLKPFEHEKETTA